LRTLFFPIWIEDKCRKLDKASRSAAPG
jgi:hypothetical protein